MHIIHQILSMTTDFWLKIVQNWSVLSVTVYSFFEIPGWFSDMLYSFLSSTKCLKNYFKKIVCSWSNRACITCKNSNFLWFFNKIWSCQVVFISIKQFYTAMNVIFETASKIELNHLYFNFFNLKKFHWKWPVGNPGASFWKRTIVKEHGSIFHGNFLIEL
jgi:hypothetical protein